MDTIKILIADDQHLFIEGLHLMLQQEPAVTITGTASNGEEALALLRKEMPDVLVTDLQMPRLDGLALTKAVKERYPSLPVLGLTIFEADHLVAKMMEAGARGYLLKTVARKDLVTAVQCVYAGGYYFCNQSSAKLLRLLDASAFSPFAPDAAAALTQTETQIIRLICQEKSTREIAELLYLGVKTIENYRTRIYEKTGTRNMAGLALFACRQGIYRP